MTQAVRRVALIFGGRSAEHRVSLASAASIARSVKPEEIQFLPVLITVEGTWVLLDSPEDAPETGARVDLRAEPGPPVLVDAERGTLHEFDAAFPVIHGPGGEDGSLQGILELAEIPFVGAGVASSAVGMDKELTKVVCEAEGLPMVEWAALRWETHRDDPAAVRRTLEAASLSPPLFVKPAALGSSVGISRVGHEGDLDAAVETAFRFHRRVLAERAIEGREVECAVLGNSTGDGLRDAPEAAEPLAEICPREGWYDYERKYTQGATDIVIPADVEEPLAADLRALALRAYRAMDVDGMARVDFLVETQSGPPKIYLNELNTIPGFTATSVYSKLWEAAGLAYPDLVVRLVELGIARRRFLDRFAAARKIDNTEGGPRPSLTG